jgi:hypothetical protein
MALPPTFATVSMPVGSLTRESRRQAVVTDGSVGPFLARQLDPRPVRRWTITLDPASRNDVRRLNDLWNITRGGILPMTYTPPGESAVAVSFDVGAELSWQQFNGKHAALDVSLVEWFSP